MSAAVKKTEVRSFWVSSKIVQSCFKNLFFFFFFFFFCLLSVCICSLSFVRENVCLCSATFCTSFFPPFVFVFVFFVFFFFFCFCFLSFFWFFLFVCFVQLLLPPPPPPPPPATRKRWSAEPKRRKRWKSAKRSLSSALPPSPTASWTRPHWRGANNEEDCVLVLVLLCWQIWWKILARAH